MKIARTGNRWLLVAVLSASLLTSDLGCRGAATPGSARLTTSQDGSTSSVDTPRTAEDRAKTAAELTTFCACVALLGLAKFGLWVWDVKNESDQKERREAWRAEKAS